MIWFLLFQLLGIAAVLLIVYGYCRFTKNAFWLFVWERLKWVGLAILVVFIVITLVCWNPLYSTAQCYFRGVSMKAETKYSWYLGECQIRTKSGSFVPIRTSRGLPDGPDGGNSELYNYE